jgi:hypothetical protein
MPTYFFDFRQDGALIKDDVGTQLPDDASAQHEAVASLAEIARDALVTAISQVELAFVMRRDDGEPIAEAEVVFRLRAAR